MMDQLELERRIIYGLACEWERAIRLLEPHYRARMRRPLFSIRDLKKRWAFWSPERREICVNRNLAMNHPWDSVCEVLLHEIAHQFRDEVFQAFHEPPHGPGFQKACYLLRANPRASGKYPALDERVSRGTADIQDRIMVRIKKLMALAGSHNPHEAEAAMAKAHKFILKYNLEYTGFERKRDFVSIFLGKPALRQSREKYHLANLLQDFYFVKGIWVSSYVMERGKMGRVLEISGTVANIQIASYVFDFVNRFIQLQWDKYRCGKELRSLDKVDFAVGVIEGFRSKLERQQKNSRCPEEKALIRIEDPRLAEYMRYRYPFIVSFRRNASIRDPRVRKDGERIGRKMVISKGITAMGEGGGKLLIGI
ncbi:MAG: SprT-like domain-containing protein [Syntrophales bacterium]